MITRTRFVLECSVSCLAGLIAAVSLAAAAKPDADFIAAALRQQEANCGSSLQINYTVGRIGTNVPNDCGYPCEVRYIRTPGFLFEEVKQGLTAVSQGTWNTRGRYDRVSGEERRLDVSATNGAKRGTIHTRDGSFGLGRRPSPDPIAFPLWPVGTLLNLIKEGVVADVQEEIDGHPCWRVDIPEKSIKWGNRMTTVKWSVWVDSEIGFCPRRVARYSDRLTPDVDDFLDYRHLGNQVYFPMRRLVKQNESGTEGMECKVQEAVCGLDVPEETAVTFPSGTHVEVLPGDANYVQP